MSPMLTLLCVCWFGLTMAVWPATYYSPEHAEENFELFIQKYNKNYIDEHEKQIRFNHFKDFLERMNRLNKNSKNAVFGITRFADLSLDEFLNTYTGLRNSSLEQPIYCPTLTDADIHYNDAPESFDWREKQVVSNVKDQIGCGSCFAFSSTGNIESQYAIKHNKIIEVSEQQIIDCDETTEGCFGGFMSNALMYVHDVGGIESEADYSYEATDGQCRFDKSKVKVKLAGCKSLSFTSQEKVKQFLYHNGPIAIAVKGDPVQGYKGGVLMDQDCANAQVNHGVLLVGYGTDEKGLKYWIVKNSWNATFGEKGYFRIQRGEGADSCGMMNVLMATAVL